MNLAQRWNELLDQEPERESDARDYIRASQMGKCKIDTVLLMTGVPKTNPANARSRRKFLMGNLIEDAIMLTLVASGTKFETQNTITVSDYPIKIVGHCDFRVTGKQKPNLEILENYPYLKRMAHELPTENGILEIKSASTFSFDKIEREDRPITAHAYQVYIYMKGLGEQKGSIVYVCKDDCRFKQFDFELGDPYMEEKIKEYVDSIYSYISTETIPFPERLILWNPVLSRFEKNFDVEYSPYLSLLYGRPDNEDELALPEEKRAEIMRTESGLVSFKIPEDYREYVDPIVRKMNATLRIANKPLREYKTEKARITGEEKRQAKITEGMKIMQEFGYIFTQEMLKSLTVPPEDTEDED